MNKGMAICFCLLSLALAACAPSAAGVGTAIAETQAAASPVPTSTPNGAGITTAIAQTQQASAESTAAFVAANGDCAVDAVLKMTADMHDLLGRWDDASQLANSTPRSGLAPQIAALQTLRRETEGLETPVCLATAKKNMVDGMNYTITAFIDFLGQKDDATVNSDFVNAKTSFGVVSIELDRVKKCAPNCK